MNTVLSGLNGTRCLVYLDDIVIFADTLETHNKKLIEIFKRLKEFNLKLKPSKCEFLRKEVIYLGHKISEKGAQPDESKLEAVKSFPRPKTTTDIKSFLGLAGYYRKFIKDFSKKALPLTSLLKKDASFQWTNLQEQAFETLKNCLTEQPILQFPDFEKSFNVTTDASNFAIGAILSQGEYPKDLPVAFASRCLNSAEINYSVIEKELLAIVWAVRHFRPYLYGRRFRIVTDHQPLTWLFNIKDPKSRLVRWRLELEEYDYAIVYKPGRVNSNADALSRNPIDSPQAENNSDEKIDSSKINCKIGILSTKNSNINKKDSNQKCYEKDSFKNKRPRKIKELKFKCYEDFVESSSNVLKIYRNTKIREVDISVNDFSDNLVLRLSKDCKSHNKNTNEIFKENHQNLVMEQNTFQKLEKCNIYRCKIDTKNVFILF